MQDLTYSLTQLTKHNRDGSYKTQADRLDTLTLIGNQLVELGWKQLHARDLKGRHVNRLVARWKQEGLSHATIRNRLAVIRWVLRKVGNPGAIPATNTVYELEPRSSVATESKAATLDRDKWAQIGDPYVRMSLELQESFGLRRDESLLLRPHQADQGQWLVLKDTWCKGKRPRAIPIITAAQREVLDRAKALVSTDASMIPAHLNLKQQRNKYTYWVSRVGLTPGHSLRHAHAQHRFAVLAGYPAPVAGGSAPSDREADTTARLIVSAELGHSRSQVTATYVGSAKSPRPPHPG
jgi:integrase